MCFLKQKKWFCILWLLTGGVLSSAGVAAQAVDTGFRHIAYIKDLDARVTGINPAGLTFLPVKKISAAGIYIDKANGGFRNYYSSDNSVSWGANTESFYRLSAKTVLQGKIAYENFNGKNMGGSAFIDPYKNPLDIDESVDTTAGTKKLERYHLTGAAGTHIIPKLALGARLDFEAANYAKTKDLRHVNKLLNMDIAAGATYTINKLFDIGFSYTHTRRIEGYIFSIHGNTDKQYLSLVNFGSFYGRMELFGGSSAAGYTNSSTGDQKPYVSKTNLLSVQLTARLRPAITLFNEFSYGKRKGYLGDKGSSSIVYTEHEADLHAYHGILSIRKKTALHKIQLNASYESLENYENVFDRITSPGGVSTIVYHGQNKMLSQDITNAAIAYTGYLKVKNNNPVWELNAKGRFFNRNQVTVLYPFYRKQDINAYGFSMQANRNFEKNKNQYSISLLLGYGGGTGTAREDGVYAQPSPSQPQPGSRDKYLYEEYEYFISPRIQTGAGLQYTRLVNNNLPVFLRIDYSFTHAFSTRYLPPSFNDIKATVGCTF